MNTPWPAIYSMWPAIAQRRRYSLDRFTAAFVDAMPTPPRYVGIQNIPSHPRFIVCANHYQRKGLWIAHPASAITQLMKSRFPIDPAVRWVVTANWPKWKFGPWQFSSPGDWLLPRVAHALWCYPVSFAGANPGLTARSFRQMLRDVAAMQQPIGLFPEGVAGVAGHIGEALPGVGRLLALLAKQGLAVLPIHIREDHGIILDIGPLVAPQQIMAASDPAALVMQSIRDLDPATRPPSPEK